jgi:hypothetical protein
MKKNEKKSVLEFGKNVLFYYSFWAAPLALHTQDDM